jgi:hypothetical protein
VRFDVKLACRALILFAAFTARPALADDAPSKPSGNASFVAADRTNIDFNDTMIDGKMQAPQGFFLQGRQGQTMSQMVRLRSKFRSELRNSKSAVKALVK